MQELTMGGPTMGSDPDPYLLSWIDRSWQVMIALYVVCTIMAGMRIFARAKVLNQFGADDGTMLLAWCFLSGMLILTLVLVGQEKRYFFGMGAPLPVEDLNRTARWWNAMYALTTIADKFSFGFFLLRTSHPKNQIQRGLTIIPCLLMGAFGLVYFGLSFTCAISYTPSTDLFSPNSQCKLTNVFEWSSVAISALAIVVDATFGLVFIWLIASCKLTQRAKILTCLTVIIGSLSGISSLGRIITIRTPRFTDPIVQISAVRFWSIMEVGICLAAPCVGSIQSFLTPYMDHPNPLGYQDPNSSRLNFSKRAQTTRGSVDEVVPGPIPPLMQADVERGVVVKVADEKKQASSPWWDPIAALMPTR